MKDVRSDTPGIVSSNALEHFQKRIRMRTTLHARQNAAAGVLQRDVQILHQPLMLRDCFEQLRCDAIRIAIKEANPAQLFNVREPFEQQRQPIAHAQIFAVESRVLPDQIDFAHA